MMANADIELNFSPREQQSQILEFVKKEVESGKKFIIIDAPTGVGKSYAAIMISEWYRNDFSKKAKIDILTNTKLLQEQYIKDFSFAANLKGKGNYWCRTHSMNCGEAAVLNQASKSICNACPYKMAQGKFLRSPISITNFHLITAYSMYSPDMLAERKSKLLIIDESHSFEETFCDFISSVYSERSIKALEIWRDWMEKDLENISSLLELSEYVSKVIVPLLLQKIEELLDSARQARGKKKKVEFLRKADHVDKSMCKFNRFIKDRENYDSNWIFEKDLDQFGKIRILTEPIWGNIYLNDLFWKEYDHVIMMSGTILNKELFSFIMGINEEESSYLALPCPFRPEKRPIIYLKFGKMSYYDKKDTFLRAVPILEKILEKNQEVKGIIHTSNYELSSWIRSALVDSRLIFHDSSSRESSLEKHLRSEHPTVIVSPSMINGIDLRDDFSRFQVILKVPFPNLMSKKIKKRLETRPEWYNWKAMIDLLQAYGRSIRNDDDWAETYILDECFDQILQTSKVPVYFKEALKIKKLAKNR